MLKTLERWDSMISILSSIQQEIKLLNTITHGKINGSRQNEMVHVPFKGSEIYLLHKAFIDAGGVPHENYKSLLEKTVPCIANKSQKGFSSESLCKYSDKVDPEAKENVKRFLQKMIRNIDSYD